MESTPLLRDQQGLPLPIGYTQGQDHPIFLRACHSPWAGINQNVLCYARGLVLAYLTALGGMLLDFKVSRDDNHSQWRLIFQFSTFVFCLLWVYHLVVFCWTFTHLHFPDIDENDRRIEYRCLRFLSPPFQSANSRRRLYFSLFYTIVHVFVFMNTLIYWAVLVPQGHGHMPGTDEGHDESYISPDTAFSVSPGLVRANYTWDDFWSDGWFKPFCLVNLYSVTSAVAVIEIFFLNSIKRQVPVPTHVFAVSFFCGSYLGWAALGRLLTGHSPFFWLDPEIVGYREVVAAYCSGFVSLGAGMFSFMYGLIGMRENITKKDQSTQEDAAQYVRDRMSARPVGARA